MVSAAPSERGATERPIFVVGYQRSGTTLLQSLLGAHPRIAAPPETHFIFRIVFLQDHYGDLADDENLRRALHDTLHPPIPLLEEAGFREDAILAKALASERTYRGLLDAVMTDFAERHGKPRWCEKTPTQAARDVFRLVPDAQVVHIVRDPRDVVASSLETPWTETSARQLAREWRRFTLENVAVGARAGPGSFLQVRYEDLTRDPEAVLRTVFAFLGEDFDQGAVTDMTRRRPTIAKSAAPWQARVLEPVTTSRQGRWQERLTRAQRIAVTATIGDLLPALGYRPSSRRDRMVARAALPVLALDDVATDRRHRRVAARATTPAERHREIQDHLVRVARTVR